MKVSERRAEAATFVGIRPLNDPGDDLIFAVDVDLSSTGIISIVKFHIAVELVMQLVGLPAIANGMLLDFAAREVACRLSVRRARS